MLLCFRGRDGGECTHDRWNLKAQSRLSANLSGLGSFGLFTFYCLFLSDNLFNLRTSLVAQVGKNLPAMQETWVRSLGWKDPLEKGMATHFSILVWRIPWTEEPGRLQSMGSQQVRHNRMIDTHNFIFKLVKIKKI